MNKVKVSICIPTFNQTEYLKKTLDSILIQTYRNYEIIITDDSSSNNVKKLIDRYNFKGRLKYFKNKVAKGSPENWNRSVGYATGKYIKILHHDDWFAKKDSLKKFVDLLDNNPKADFAFSATLFTHTINKKQIRSLNKSGEILFLGNFIGAPSATIYKRGLNIKYDRNLQWFVDVDFYVKVLAKNSNFVYSPEPLINVTADAAHQVTKQCINNKEVELFESIYLYGKIKNNRIRIKHFLNLVHLINKYQIFSVNDIPKKDKLTISTEIGAAVKLNKVLNFLRTRGVEIKQNILSKSKHISYSQCGEDIIVDSVFNQLGIPQPSYLDLGAFYPIYMSNTYFFYKSGCRGVCVEPDPFLFNKIKKQRRRDIYLNIGVGSKNKKMDFFVMSSRSLNTFIKEKAEALSTNGKQKVEHIMKVQVRPVNKIILEYFGGKSPNFISLDSEGLDYEILESFDFKKYRPEVLCIETLTYVEDNTEEKILKIIEMMKKKDYFVYADTYINTIFVDKEAWKNRFNEKQI